MKALYLSLKLTQLSDWSAHMHAHSTGHHLQIVLLGTGGGALSGPLARATVSSNLGPHLLNFFTF